MATDPAIIKTAGRRKNAVAAIQLTAGAGKLSVNGRDLNAYFPVESMRTFALQPMKLTNTEAKFDVRASLAGGGPVGQAGALRLGIARALVAVDEEARPVLKAAGFLTRDARAKESKKYGLKKARKAPQYSKR